MGIPQARDELMQIVTNLRNGDQGDNAIASDIEKIISEHMHRKTAARRGSRDSTKMTPELASAIRAYAAADPKLSQRAIGEHFNVSSGRVSEALNGKR